MKSPGVLGRIRIRARIRTEVGTDINRCSVRVEGYDLAWGRCGGDKPIENSFKMDTPTGEANLASSVVGVDYSV